MYKSKAYCVLGEKDYLCLTNIIKYLKDICINIKNLDKLRQNENNNYNGFDKRIKDITNQIKGIKSNLDLIHRGKYVSGANISGDVLNVREYLIELYSNADGMCNAVINNNNVLLIEYTRAIENLIDEWI